MIFGIVWRVGCGLLDVDSYVVPAECFLFSLGTVDGDRTHDEAGGKAPYGHCRRWGPWCFVGFAMDGGRDQQVAC